MVAAGAASSTVAVVPGPTSPSVVRGRHPTAAVLMVACLGFLVLGRSFAYVGVPRFQLYAAELLLGAVVVLRPTRHALRNAYRALWRPGPDHVHVVLLAGLCAVGGLAALRGVQAGYDPDTILKSVAFNYYPIFLLVGAWWGRQDPRVLRTVTLWLARINGYYGVAFVLVLSGNTTSMYGQTDVPLFGNGNASGLAVLGLLVYHRHRTETPALLALNSFVMLGIQQRSEWIAFLAGLVALAILLRRARVLVQASAAAAGLLIVIAVAGVSVPGASHRGGEISATEIFARVIAPVAPKLVPEGADGTRTYAATAHWRTTWWSAIWDESRKDVPTAVLGHAYGYPLYKLGKDVPAVTRTPHNVFLYALAYTGWLGVSLALLLFGRMAHALTRRVDHPDSRFGLVVLVYTLVLALLGNWFESPFGAVPTYLVLGAALTSAAAGGRASALTARGRTGTPPRVAPPPAPR